MNLKMIRRSAVRVGLAFGLALAVRSSFAAPARHVFNDGDFCIGCNYWASHAGMYMWRKWDAKTVERDVADLSSQGVEMMRVFPLWPDFQPVDRLCGYAGEDRGIGMVGDRPMPNDAGVDDEMMMRFRFLCDCAQARGAKLVVGLVTGWMSGRIFVPPAFRGKNVLTDAETVEWQVRFVRHFVREMKDHPAIVAWDFGNECNCMGTADRAQFWCWMNQIASAIRLEDASRPVVSGMHGLKTRWTEMKSVYAQGELADVLTTHPYPLFTPHCAKEPYDSMRSELHASAESLLYAGLTGRPCFVEEAGDLGRCTVSPERSAAAVRTDLFSSWANGLGAYLWWCGYDQGHLDFPPYTWNAIERELGLFTKDRVAKPVLQEMTAFRDFRRSLPPEIARLPSRRIDAVCLVSENEDYWPQAFGAFLLARQAGFDIRFARAERELPEAKLYLVPSGTECDPFTSTAWNRVFARARDAGATVLVTKGEHMRFSDLRALTGNRLDAFFEKPLDVVFTVGGKRVAGHDTTTTRLTAEASEVLATAEGGSPVVTGFRLGKGQVVFVNFALELDAVLRGGFSGPNPNPRYAVYRLAAERAGIKRVATKGDAPSVGLTEHPLADGRTVVVAVNYEPTAVTCPIRLAAPLGKVYRGLVLSDSIRLGPNDAAVFAVETSGR